MNDIREIKSIVNEKIMNIFYPDYKVNNFSLYDYATWKCGIDGLIAASCIYLPEIICYKEYIFIKQFMNIDANSNISDIVEKLEEQYDYDKKLIEMSVNTWSIGDFFVGKQGKFYDSYEVINQFAECLIFFWGKRFKDVLPDRNMVVESGENIMGEYGLCITCYEAI